MQHPGETDRPPQRTARAARRVLLRARGPVARRAAALGYLAMIRAIARYLIRGEHGAAVYLLGGVGGNDFVPGLSDVDLDVVVPPGDPDGTARVRRRYERLRRLPFGHAFDRPRAFEQTDLAVLYGSSCFTTERSVYSREGGAKVDAVRTVERPELYGDREVRRLIAGPDCWPAAPARDRQDERIAAWLELVWWWRMAALFLVDPGQPRAADLAVKLAAESARVWLWLARGERAAGRGDVLQRMLRALPEEEPALRCALDTRTALQRLPAPPWDVLLPLAVRLSVRVAEVLDAEIAGAGFAEVRLVGDAADLIPGGGLPLADWRELACLEPPDDSFVPGELPADDPAAHRSGAADGPYPALRSGPLLVLPGVGHPRTRLRSVKCAAVDPVPFAVLDGERVARFPEVRGWSASDTARRAVAEHTARLEEAPAEPGLELGLLLSAARAALFRDSVRAGAPELCVTVAEAARRIDAGHEFELYRAFRLGGEPPPAPVVESLRGRVRSLLLAP